MAFRRGGGKPPKWNISFSVKLRDGEYKKGPSIGLWPSDQGPTMARGTTKGEYAESLAAFFDRYARKENGISVSLFENEGKSSRRNRDDDDDDYEDRKRKRQDDDDDDDDDRPRKRHSRAEEDDDDDDDDLDEPEEETPRRKKVVKRKAPAKGKAKPKKRYG